MKPFSLKERIDSFRYAFNGIRLTIWAEHNFRIHLVATVLVVGLGFYFDMTASEWLWITFVISLVLITEMINTAIEKLVDLAEPNQNPLAGKIKDIAAGAVLIAAITAVVIGALIFWPYFCIYSA